MSKQNKVACLVLDQPGAPEGWHTVAGLNGLVHPSVPVPHPGAERFVEAHEKRNPELRKAHDKLEDLMEKAEWRRNGRRPFEPPPCPVKVVHVTEKQAAEGEELHAEARQEAVSQLRKALRSQDDVEATLAHNEASALTGEEE